MYKKQFLFILFILVLAAIMLHTFALRSNKDNKIPVESNISNILDFLNIPDIKDKKFVLYNSGNPYQTHDNYGSIFKTYNKIGWLIFESKEIIRILRTNLTIVDYKRNQIFLHGNLQEKPTPGNYVELQYSEYCDNFISLANDKLHRPSRMPNEAMDLSTQAIILAYWANILEMKAKNKELLDIAKKNFSESKNLVNEVATGIKNQAIIDADHLSFLELIKIWSIVEKFPEYSIEAELMIRRYEQLIEENKRSPKLTKEQFNKITTSEKALYLINQFNNVAMFLRNYRKNETNPTAELINLGFDIVPILIEHFDDERLTRTVMWKGSALSRFKEPRIIRYGEFCREIFSRMSGVELREQSDYKKTAKTWWSIFQEKGEKLYLLESVAKGENYSYYKVKMIVDKYPDLAFNIIQQCIQSLEKSLVPPFSPFFIPAFFDKTYCRN